MALYSAFPLEQARRAVGLPRAVPLSGLASMLLQIARRIEPSGLGITELNEATRVLGGISSALQYEKLRSNGWNLSEGWDNRAPATNNLSLTHEHVLRHSSNQKNYVTEPSHLTARDIHALETLAQNRRWEISVSANSLSLPGEALCVSIRSRY